MTVAVKKFLIVDDEDGQRKAVREALKFLKGDIQEASSGTQALEMIGAGLPTLILLDIIMPGLHGLDVLEKMKERAISVPVIMLVSPREQALLARALSLGAVDSISKPARTEDVIRAVTKALKGSESSPAPIPSPGARQLKALQEGSQKLAALKGQDVTAESLLDSRAMLNTTLDLIADVLDSEKVSLMIVDDAKRELRLVASHGFDAVSGGGPPQKIGEGIAGLVAEKGEPILVKDVAKDPRFAGGGERRSRYKTNSFLSAPLMLKDRVIGVISVNDKKGGEPFAEGDLSILLTFSHQISLTIENAIMGRDLKKHAEKLAFLTHLNRSILEEADPKKIYLEIARTAHRVLDVEACAMFLLEETSGAYLCAGGWGDGGEIPAGSGVPCREGESLIFSLSQVSAVPVSIVADTGRDPRFHMGTDGIGECVPRSLAAAPIRLRDRTLGVIAAANKKGDRPFSGRDAEVLEALSLSSSMALKIAWLHDNLVQAMDDVARLEMEVEKRKGSP